MTQLRKGSQWSGHSAAADTHQLLALTGRLGLRRSLGLTDETHLHERSRW